MVTFYSVFIDGMPKWIFGENEEKKALKAFRRLSKKNKYVFIDRKDTDELGMIKRVYIYDKKCEAWTEEREGRGYHGGLLYHTKKLDRHCNVRGKRRAGGAGNAGGAKKE